MSSKSKIKGTTYETKIKKILSEHYKLKFERVPLSGALEYLKGDIWCPEKFYEWPYTIECKHYKQLNFNSLLTAKSNDIWSFWKQTLEEAKIMKKKPLLIFKWDRSKDFVMWDDELELPTQIKIKAFNYEVKIAELSLWLKYRKI